VVVEETCVVVIVNEDTEGRDVTEVRCLLIVAGLDAAHILTIAENIADGVVHRVVEKSGDWALIGTNVGGVSVKALTHLENTTRRSKLRPKVLANLRDRVNSNAVETVGRDEISDP
jgi:hypothetical protein